MIFSPMIIEGGIPLLISNSELSFIPDAMEFFAKFPEARNSLQLSTAVRMNAAFPYLTPAVSLPTMPPYRVVDAGYLDNYGVSLAADWIADQRDWLMENTSGIILVQIRAYPRDQVDREQIMLRFIRSGTQWITSPIEGLSTAKRSAMIARNHEKLEMLRMSFNGHGESFLSRFVFEAIEEMPLSWALSSADRKKLESALRTEGNERSFAGLVSLLQSTSDASAGPESGC
jgi:hypothetical protein